METTNKKAFGIELNKLNTEIHKAIREVTTIQLLKDRIVLYCGENEYIGNIDLKEIYLILNKYLNIQLLLIYSENNKLVLDYSLRIQKTTKKNIKQEDK